MALEKFCFCCKLRNGAFIWGILCILRSFIVFVAVAASADIFTGTKNNDMITFRSDSYGSDSHYDTRKSPSPLFWTIIIMSIIDLISSIMLVVGAAKRNHFLMLPWIVLNGIAMVPLGIATVMLLIVFLPIYGPVYIWWCICSAYQKVQENRPPPYDKVLLTNSSVDRTSMS